MTIDNLLKEAGLNCKDTNRFIADVESVSRILESNLQDHTTGNYNVHTLNGERVGQIAADAKYLNKQNGQSKRGSLRLVFDRSTFTLLEIAREVSNGAYKTLCRVRDDSIKQALDISRSNEIQYEIAVANQARNEIERISLTEENMRNGMLCEPSEIRSMQIRKQICQRHLDSIYRGANNEYR